MGRRGGIGSAGMRGLAAFAAVGALVLTGCTAEQAEYPSLAGSVAPLADVTHSWTVTAWAAAPDGSAPVALGTDDTGDDGSWSISFDDAAPPDTGVVYVTATSDESDATLAAVATPYSAAADAQAAAQGGAAAASIAATVLNERTTVAMAYAMAQFAHPDGVAGTAPGLANAAAMSRNLADPYSGELGEVLTSAPNGSETSTLPTFVSLVSMLIGCVASDAICADLYEAATPPGGEAPDTTLAAFADIAASPAADVDALFDLAQHGQLASEPGLAEAPDAWTLALRFDGDGESLDGPGNFAIDPDGHIWVNNNYAYGSDPSVAVCASDELFEFLPDGSFADGSPYSGGGLSGSGFGIVFDRTGQLWVSNYGFAAPEPGCPADEQPPHDSVSLFDTDGQPIVDEPYTQGELNWPQGTIVADDGTIWLANCNTSTLTMYPQGDPDQAAVVSDLGLQQAFGLVDNGSFVFATGTASSTVAVLDRAGTPLAGSPLSGAFDRPMGIAADAAGNVWVANSGAITLPCPDRPEVGPPATGSVTMISPDGQSVSGPFGGGGVSTPWGIATDGVGNVWVAEFSGQRLVAFCGADPTVCPPGSATGDALSPDGTGFGFDGLTRSTGVAVDPSGNVWVTNNWLLEPVQTNPGGHHIVAFLGIAPPVAVEPFE